MSRSAIVGLLVICDGSIILAAAGFAHAVYFGASEVLSDDFLVGLLAALFFIFFALSRGLYNLDSAMSAKRALEVFGAISLNVLTVALLFFASKTGSYHSRAVVALFYFLAAPGVSAGRLASGVLLRRAIDEGRAIEKRVVVIGERREFQMLEHTGKLDHGVDEVARFERQCDTGRPDEQDSCAVKMAVSAARALHAEEIALFISPPRKNTLDEIRSLLRVSPARTRLYPDYQARNVLSLHRGAVDSNLIIEVQREPLRRHERIAKRIFDIVVAAALLCLLAPCLLMTAFVIKLETPGPAIFRQRRMGFDQKVFTIFKFRTMQVCEDGRRIVQASKSDLRITKFGRWLRRTSCDELPQLVNVLLGDMSLVGPRPHALAHDVEYSAKISDYALRHHVKPGLTGAAQVRGYRGETRTLKQMQRRIDWDLWYISNWSFVLDMRIIFQTFSALIFHEVY